MRRGSVLAATDYAERHHHGHKYPNSRGRAESQSGACAIGVAGIIRHERI